MTESLKPAVLVADPLSMDVVRTFPQEVEIFQVDKNTTLNAETAPQIFQELGVVPDRIIQLIVRSNTKVTEGLVNQLPNLLAVGRAGSGVDNIKTDLAAKDIALFNAPDALTNAVAEQTVGTLLSLAHNIQKGNRDIKEKRIWSKKAIKKDEISGKKLVVIGVGRIGRAVAQKVTALGMDVYGYDPKIKEKNWPEGIKRIKSNKDLDTHLSDTFSVSLHPWALKKPILSQRRLDLLKPGTIVINTSRPKNLNFRHLSRLVGEGKLRAGIDVFRNEPLKLDKRKLKKGIRQYNPTIEAFVKSDDTILTPHISAQSKEAQKKAAEAMVNGTQAVIYRHDEIPGIINGKDLDWERWKSKRDEVLNAFTIGYLGLPEITN